MLAVVGVAGVLIMTRVADELRGPVENAVEQALGVPVNLGKVGLGWVGLQPVATLGGLQIQPDAPGGAWFSAEALHLHMRWGDLMRRRWTPYRVTAVSARLQDSPALRDWIATRAAGRDGRAPQGVQLAFRDLQIDGGDRLPGAIVLPSGWLDWFPAEGAIEGQTKALLSWGSFDAAHRETAAALDLSGRWREGRGSVEIGGLDTVIADAPALTLTMARRNARWQGALGPAGADAWVVWNADADGLHASGEMLPIDLVFPLLQRYVPAITDDWAATGQLRDLRGDWRWRRPDPQMPRFSVQARLESVALRNGASAIEALHGYLALDELGGYFLPAAPMPAITLAGWQQPLRLERLEGEWLWAQQPGGEWRVAVPELRVAAEGAQVAGHVRGIAGGALRSPQLDIDLQVDAESLAAMHPYWPGQWPQPLRKWLKRAVTGGQLDGARLQIKGPAADFPYHRRPTGFWQLKLPVRDGGLAFAPDWPALTQANADLTFTGNRMSVTLAQARFGPVRQVSGQAEIKAMNNDAVLEISGKTRDDVPALLSLMNQSPLQDRFARLAEAADITGPAAVEVQLDIPLAEVKDARVSGRVALESVEMRLSGVDTPVTDVTGHLDFSGNSLSGDDLSGRWHGSRVSGVLEGGDEGVILDLLGKVLPVSALDQWLPEPVSERLSGVFDWSGQLSLPRQGVATFTAQSPLHGVAVTLPSPLEKPEADARRVQLELPLPASAEAPIRFSWGGQFLTGEIADNRIELRVGDPSADLVAALGAAPGLWVAADLPPIEALPWLRWLTRFTDAPAVPADADGQSERVPAQLAGAEVHAAGLRVERLSVRDQRASVRRTAQGLTAMLSGAAEGEVQTTERGGLLQLQSLALRLDPPDEPDWQAAAEPLPPLAEHERGEYVAGAWAGQIATLAVNGLNLGTAALTAELPARGQIALDLALSGDGALVGAGSFSADGSLRGSRGRFETDRPQPVMAALGIEAPLEADRAGISWDLAWPASGTRLSIPTAEGDLKVWARQGQLRAIDPGAGRLLGLFSFYQLPRRLLFDFRDVTDDGLHFDSLDADLRLEYGRVVTDDLTLRAPSLRMAVKGETHLLTRRLDQRVTVYPDYASGVSIGAALLGGPAAGVLVLLAQTLLDKPLEAVGQFGYRIRGTWDDPEIEKLDAASGNNAAARADLETQP